MKEMSFEQMESLNGGGECSDSAEKFIATVGFATSVGSCFGPIGLLICGPTALGMGILSMYCAW